MNDMTRVETGVQSPALFSIEEFQQLVDTGVFEGSRVELVEGVPIRMSPALPRHMYIQNELAFDLREIFGKGIDGWVAGFEATIQFGGTTLRDLDVAIIRGLAEAESYLPPENVLLAIEISSTTLQYDLNEKRVEYARGGIPHYWVVDASDRRVHLMSKPLDGDYTERHLVAFGDEIAVPGTDATVRIGTA